MDLPGEAQTIMHKKENVGLVELATISFGQSFQVTPIQMAATASALINGGRRVTPHLGVRILDSEGEKGDPGHLNDAQGKRILSEETSAQMRGSPGKRGGGGLREQRLRGRIPDRRENSHLPDPSKERGKNTFLLFLGFAPADDPQILAMCVIYDPKGVYYGGTIAAPVIVFRNIFHAYSSYNAALKKSRKCSILCKVKYKDQRRR